MPVHVFGEAKLRSGAAMGDGSRMPASAQPATAAAGGAGLMRRSRVSTHRMSLALSGDVELIRLRLRKMRMCASRLHYRTVRARLRGVGCVRGAGSGGDPRLSQLYTDSRGGGVLK